MKVFNIGNHSITVTHGEKLIFPEDGISRYGLIDYYLKIAPYILPFVLDRPITLQRCLSDISQCFFRQHASTFFLISRYG